MTADREPEGFFASRDESLEREVNPGEIVIGSISGMDGIGQPLVIYAGSPEGEPRVAISTVAVTRADVGRQIALLFADGSLKQPVIMGFIHSPLYALLETGLQQAEEGKAEEDGDEASRATVAHVDGRRVVIEGRDEVTLKCGESSITLTRAGKIIIRGKYVLSRSSGVNRIMGGSVQVN